jgi:hypothetical protein
MKRHMSCPTMPWFVAHETLLFIVSCPKIGLHKYNVNVHTTRRFFVLKKHFPE